MKKTDPYYFALEHRPFSPVLEQQGWSHAHDYFEVYFMLAGECKYFISNHVISVKEKSIVLIPKGVQHKTIYLSEACERILLSFSREYINNVFLNDLYRLFPSCIYLPTQKNLADILRIFEKMELELERKDDLSFELLRGYVSEIFAMVLRSNDRIADTTEKKGRLLIEDALEYLERNFQTELTLKDLAKQSAMSESAFSRSFKEITGMGFKEYLNSVRAREASRYLMNTDLSVCEIAYKCGFNDSNYFSTFFKKIHGISPLKFRKNSRKL